MGIGTLLQPTEYHCGWSKTEGDNIGQRIKFLADRRAHLQGTSGEAIKKVKYGTSNNQGEGYRVYALKSKYSSYATRKEIATGDGIGDMFAHNDV